MHIVMASPFRLQYTESDELNEIILAYLHKIINAYRHVEASFLGSSIAYLHWSKIQTSFTVDQKL